MLVRSVSKPVLDLKIITISLSSYSFRVMTVYILFIFHHDLLANVTLGYSAISWGDRLGVKSVYTQIG